MIGSFPVVAEDNIGVVAGWSINASNTKVSSFANNDETMDCSRANIVMVTAQQLMC